MKKLTKNIAENLFVKNLTSYGVDFLYEDCGFSYYHLYSKNGLCAGIFFYDTMLGVSIVKDSTSLFSSLRNYDEIDISSFVRGIYDIFYLLDSYDVLKQLFS